LVQSHNIKSRGSRRPKEAEEASYQDCNSDLLHLLHFESYVKFWIFLILFEIFNIGYYHLRDAFRFISRLKAALDSGKYNDSGA